MQKLFLVAVTLDAHTMLAPIPFLTGNATASAMVMRASAIMLESLLCSAFFVSVMLMIVSSEHCLFIFATGFTNWQFQTWKAHGGILLHALKASSMDVK